MSRLTVAVCTYNRAHLLPGLITALRELKAPVEWDILVVNNNSTDDTDSVLKALQNQPGIPLRYVSEPQQGIPFARNRAIEECLERDYMLFMDDDEIPGSKFISAALKTFDSNDADCVGGRVKVQFPESTGRPKWLTDSLMGFLAEIDYGADSFRVTDKTTPLWTANIGYRMQLFRDNSFIRFDIRYNRAGEGVGGGSDAIMFRSLLNNGFRIFYAPEMIVYHYVEEWRIRRLYFIKLHFNSGRKHGQFELGQFDRTIFGIPPFLLIKAGKHILVGLGAFLMRDPEVVRKMMNTSHTLGTIWGLFLRWRSVR